MTSSERKVCAGFLRASACGLHACACMRMVRAMVHLTISRRSDYKPIDLEHKYMHIQNKTTALENSRKYKIVSINNIDL